jgi:DNA processing protein
MRRRIGRCWSCGTGLDRVYPPEHAALQELIAREGAIVSQFWPEALPSRQSFPARNAVMSGMTLGSVIVEASEHSGTRIQARQALAQGRIVVLMPPALELAWARELAERQGVVVAQDVADVVDVFRR